MAMQDEATQKALSPRGGEGGRAARRRGLAGLSRRASGSSDLVNRRACGSIRCPGALTVA